MKNKYFIQSGLAWSILLVCFATFSFAQTVVMDRLLVLVNRDVITESDVLWALSLDSDLPILELTAENRRGMLERLIDQKLLLQEAEKIPRHEPAEEEITDYINHELVAKFGSNDKFIVRMKKVGLEQVMLREIVRRRLEILRYVEFRFRSFVFIKPEDIEEYYKKTVIPEAARNGLGAPELNEALRTKIEKDLSEIKVNSELDRFFDETRAQAQITRLATIQ